MSDPSPRIRAAAIITRDDEILLVKHLKGERVSWLLPGGGVDYGESLPLALQRELQEELCVESEVGELALVNDAIDPAGSRHLIQVAFHATIQGTPVLGEDPRIVEVAWVPIAELDTLRFHPDMAGHIKEYLQNADIQGGYLGNFWRD